MSREDLMNRRVPEALALVNNQFFAEATIFVVSMNTLI